MAEPIEMKFSLNTLSHAGFKVCFGEVDPLRRWPCPEPWNEAEVSLRDFLSEVPLCQAIAFRPGTKLIQELLSTDPPLYGIQKLKNDMQKSKILQGGTQFTYHRKDNITPGPMASPGSPGSRTFPAQKEW